jgi:hypothetical protein
MVRPLTRENGLLPFWRGADAQTPFLRRAGLEVGELLVSSGGGKAVLWRCEAVLKIAQGETPHAVARQGLLKSRDPDTLYGWLAMYEEEGVAGLVAHQHGGKRRRSL